MAIIRVGELREFLEDVPDSTEIYIFTDDNGTDWGQRLGVRRQFASEGTQIGGFAQVAVAAC